MGHAKWIKTLWRHLKHRLMVKSTSKIKRNCRIKNNNFYVSWGRMTYFSQSTAAPDLLVPCKILTDMPFLVHIEWRGPSSTAKTCSIWKSVTHCVTSPGTIYFWKACSIKICQPFLSQKFSRRDSSAWKINAEKMKRPFVSLSKTSHQHKIIAYQKANF